MIYLLPINLLEITEVELPLSSTSAQHTYTVIHCRNCNLYITLTHCHLIKLFTVFTHPSDTATVATLLLSHVSGPLTNLVWTGQAEAGTFENDDEDTQVKTL